GPRGEGARGVLGLPAQNGESLVGLGADGARGNDGEASPGARHMEYSRRHGSGVLFRGGAASMVSDVFVIGGGPAGLAAAIAARRTGFAVTLCDSRHPPIDKACGEGLMPGALAAAKDLGIDPRAAASFPLRGVRF